MNNCRGLKFPSLLVPMALGLLIGVGAVVAGEGLKGSSDSEIGLSDAERQATITKLKARNVEWLTDFIREGRDPRPLPVVEIPTYSAGATDVDNARTQADTVVRGLVTAVRYVQRDEILPLSVATVSVQDVVRGHAEGDIAVQQIGGPAWSSSGGQLMMLQGDPLLLPGQEVILLLKAGSGLDFQTVYGAGVYLVIGNTVQAPDTNGFADLVNGLSPEAVLALFE